MKKMLKVNMLRLLLGMSTLVFFGISGSFTAYAGDTPAAPQQHKRVVKGRVTDKKTGEPIVELRYGLRNRPAEQQRMLPEIIRSTALREMQSFRCLLSDIKARKWYWEKKM